MFTAVRPRTVYPTLRLRPHGICPTETLHLKRARLISWMELSRCHCHLFDLHHCGPTEFVKQMLRRIVYVRSIARAYKPAKGIAGANVLVKALYAFLVRLKHAFAQGVGRRAPRVVLRMGRCGVNA